MGGWEIIRFLFRAAHDQRFAAGPRQGHFVLDPEKCRRIFRLQGVEIWWALSGSWGEEALCLNSKNELAFFEFTEGVDMVGPAGLEPATR